MSQNQRTKKVVRSKNKTSVDNGPSEVSIRLQKWREEQSKKELIIAKQKEEKKRREEIFVSKFADESIVSDAWRQVFTYTGLGIDLCRCSMVSKFWQILISEGKDSAFSVLFSKMFGEHKPEELTWSDVFSSFPSLSQALSTKIDALCCTRIFYNDKLCTKDITVAHAIYQWTLVYGFLSLSERAEKFIKDFPKKMIKDDYPQRGIERFYDIPLLCRSMPPWSPKITLILCLKNGHIKLVKHLLQKYEKLLYSFPETELFAAALISVTESSEKILEISAYLPDSELYHIVFQTLMIGELEEVDALQKQGKKNLFKFTNSQCAQIVDKCFKVDSSFFQKHENQAWQEELENTLKTMRISGVARAQGRNATTIEKNFSANRLEVLRMIIENGIIDRVSMNQIIPCVGPIETYKFYIDHIKDVPVDLPFNVCASAKTQVDYEFFAYLFESKKCSPNVVNRFGNGLVYTAFVNANPQFLNILKDHGADPNIYANSSANTLFDLAAHSTRFLHTGSNGGIKEEVLIPLLNILLGFKDLRLPPFNELMNYACYLTSDMLIKMGVPFDCVDNDGLTILQRSINYNESTADVQKIISSEKCTIKVINYHGEDKTIPSYLPALALTFFADREDSAVIGADLVKAGASLNDAINAIKKMKTDEIDDDDKSSIIAKIKSLAPIQPEIPISSGFSFSMDSSKFNLPEKDSTQKSAFSSTLDDLAKEDAKSSSNPFSFSFQSPGDTNKNLELTKK